MRPKVAMIDRRALLLSLDSRGGLRDSGRAHRGRAMIDFEVQLRQLSNRLQRDLEAELAGRGVTAETLPEAMEERHRIIDATLSDWVPARTRALLGEWCAKEHGRACEQAFDEVRDTIGPVLDALALGPTTIEHPPHFVAPPYWSNVWFHRTSGGWDASRYNGFVHGELVHRRYVSKVFPGDIYAQRRRVLDELAQVPRRVVEFGTSSGHYTRALSERFPEASIIGLDPSLRMLEQAQRIGNEMGQNWRLIVGVGEESRLADASCDLVTSYAIHHELPPRIIARWFEEAYRLLAPGGEMLMIDVPRYADLDRLAAWRFDWAAKWGGEPYWRSSASLDFGDGARAAGFVDVRAEGIAPAGNPYYVYGRKPHDA
jgi:SAM-dependent methyltransferase